MSLNTRMCWSVWLRRLYDFLVPSVIRNLGSLREHQFRLCVIQRLSCVRPTFADYLYVAVGLEICEWQLKLRRALSNMTRVWWDAIRSSIRLGEMDINDVRPRALYRIYNRDHEL